tara:strand:+ start:126 stop:317 length:192 start_codon:yes stop_codon:yes gene_type:complete
MIATVANIALSHVVEYTNFMFDITTKNGHGLSPLAVLKNTDLLSLRGRSLCMKGNVKVLPMQE